MEDKIKAGDTLVHPIHGPMLVANVNYAEYEEYVEATQKFEKGYRIEAVFDRFIPGVKWTAQNGKGERVSKLIFHSWYLRNLKHGKA